MALVEGVGSGLEDSLANCGNSGRGGAAQLAGYIGKSSQSPANRKDALQGGVADAERQAAPVRETGRQAPNGARLVGNG